MKPNLAVVESSKSVVRNRPLAKSGRILWPWRLTSLQRIHVQHASFRLFFDKEHLARVLDARSEGQQATRKPKKVS
jgi:hypothetical protein